MFSRPSSMFSRPSSIFSRPSNMFSSWHLCWCWRTLTGMATDVPEALKNAWSTESLWQMGFWGQVFGAIVLLNLGMLLHCFTPRWCGYVVARDLFAVLTYSAVASRLSEPFLCMPWIVHDIYKREYRNTSHHRTALWMLFMTIPIRHQCQTINHRQRVYLAETIIGSQSFWAALYLT